jgi:hypothetical protein
MGDDPFVSSYYYFIVEKKLMPWEAVSMRLADHLNKMLLVLCDSMP